MTDDELFKYLRDKYNDRVDSGNKTSKATFYKLSEYPRILDAHIKASRSDGYTVMDLTAGCGYDNIPGCKKPVVGSPGTAASVLANQPGLRAELITVEIKKPEYDALCDYFRLKPPLCAVRLYNGDNADPGIIGQLKPSHPKGLMYFDHFGATMASTVKLYRNNFPKFDLLIRMPLAQLCRNLGSWKSGINLRNPYPITELITNEGQYKHWLISDPKLIDGCVAKWCWILGTNNKDVQQEVFDYERFIDPPYNKIVRFFSLLTKNLNGEFICDWSDKSLNNLLKFKINMDEIIDLETLDTVNIPKAHFNLEIQDILKAEKELRLKKMEVIKKCKPEMEMQVVVKLKEAWDLAQLIQKIDATYSMPAPPWLDRLGNSKAIKRKVAVDIKIKNLLTVTPNLTNEEIIDRITDEPAEKITQSLINRSTGKRNMFMCAEGRYSIL